MEVARIDLRDIFKGESIQFYGTKFRNVVGGINIGLTPVKMEFFIFASNGRQKYLATKDADTANGTGITLDNSDDTLFMLNDIKDTSNMPVDNYTYKLRNTYPDGIIEVPQEGCFAIKSFER